MTIQDIIAAPIDHAASGADRYSVHQIRSAFDIGFLQGMTHGTRQAERRAIGWMRQDGSLHKGCPPLGEPAGWVSIYSTP